MFNKKIVLILFVAMALVQLYVPASIILNREKILTFGKQYKFKTAPVDPNDPFRGKYITLQYDARIVKTSNNENWYSNQDVYATLIQDKNGFASIQKISYTKPTANTDFINATIDYKADDSTVYLNLPFTQFYMEETKAPKAEVIYNTSNTDSTKKTYALVSLYKGESVIKDVFINDTSISKLILNK